MLPFFSPDSSYLYSYVEALRHSVAPLRLKMLLTSEMLERTLSPFQNSHMNNLAKSNIEILERITRTYKKPVFGIKTCEIDGKEEKVKKMLVRHDPFCNLIHFVKPNYEPDQPKLLIVAPMSGHHATLLRGTVQDTLPHFDVYITDWIDANQVPICDGSFDMDSYIDYVMNYIRLLGPNVHVYAVCQPTVPVLAATALMSETDEEHVPKSLILTGGPIDARKNPTVPNDFAIKRNLQWFDSMMISSVPANYPGHRRRVYPGFLQLLGFVSMNVERHVTSHFDMYKNLLVEDDEEATKQKKFYDEYFSVMDLTAEFYLQTIKEVFHDFSLAKGKFVSRGRKVDLRAIKKCALLGIEGEKDDIAAVGQTKAALNLCSSIPENMKRYHLQKGVGHYGAFSGSKFRNVIVPAMKEFVYSHN